MNWRACERTDDMRSLLNPVRELFYRRFDEIRLICVDLETTGFNPGRGDEVIAFGAVTIEDGQIVWKSCTQLLFNPGRPIPPAVTRLTGITDAMVKDKARFYDALPQVLPHLRGGILLGYRLEFDLSFLNRALEGRYQRRLVNPTVDLLELVRVVYPRFRSYSLDRVLAALGLNGRYRRHSALGDALATAEAFLSLLDALGERGIYSLADLYDYRLYHRYAEQCGFDL